MISLAKLDLSVEPWSQSDGELGGGRLMVVRVSQKLQSVSEVVLEGLVSPQV